jgi:hypothetical protein
MSLARAGQWALAFAVFAACFAVFSTRLGVEPLLSPDDYEYTYPSFALAETGGYAAPLLGPALNLENRAYLRPVYYHATVHAALIRASSDGPEAVPLANTLHFSLLAAAGMLFLLRRAAFLGAAAFLWGVVTDRRLVEAARQGRPDVTAACWLFVAVLVFWLWRGEGRRRLSVLLGMSAALTAGILSHPSVLVFAALILVALTPSLRKDVPWRTTAMGLSPFAALPLLWGYFLLTDSLANLLGQLRLGWSEVPLGLARAFVARPHWSTLRDTSAFVGEELAVPGLWLALAACLALPGIAGMRVAPAARFFGTVYALFFVVRLLFLEQPLPAYRALDRPLLYLTLALVAEAAIEWVGRSWSEGRLTAALRLAAVTALVCLTARTLVEFRSTVHARPLPYESVRRVLAEALVRSGARRGDRVLAPSSFAFHLRGDFDVVAQPAPLYAGRWSAAFRGRLEALAGDGAGRRTDERSLCYAAGLALVRPRWILSWNEDDGSQLPFRTFLRNFPELPGMWLVEAGRVPLTPPYSGVVRVYQLTLSERLGGLDTAARGGRPSCP